MTTSQSDDKPSTTADDKPKAATTTKTAAKKRASASPDPQAGILPRRTDGETIYEKRGKSWVAVGTVGD